MKFKMMIASILALALLSANTCLAGDDNEKKREKSRKMAAQTLEDLYKKQPQAQALIQKSAGYAVFNNMGTNLFVLSTARGAGIAINSQTKQETFMKMISAGAGLGLGVKDYRVVFVVREREGPDTFPRIGLVGFSANGCCGQGRRVGRSLLGGS